MVRVRIGLTELEIKGHAQSAEPGHDLVCCAVSILAETLSRYMEYYEANGCLQDMENRVEPGDTTIRATPIWPVRERVVTAFETIRFGLRALAEEYPEYITLEEE